jgi:hypothetical protein
MIENVQKMKVLMDCGSGINILYKDTFDKLKINLRKLHVSEAPFHEVVSGWHGMPLGTIVLTVTFGDYVNYYKETLLFEVVGFNGTYHAILRRPCYAKFMAIRCSSTPSTRSQRQRS